MRVDANNSSGTAVGSVRRSQRILIRASGSWCSGGIKAPGVASCGGPEGIRPAGPGEKNDLMLKGQPVGILIGRIGNWVFPIGNNTTIIAQADGPLSLLMNDRQRYYFDNSGSISVEVEVN